MRGEHAKVAFGKVNDNGSSPRARGTHRCSSDTNRKGRVIPACAGNTSGEGSGPPVPPGHPRVRGEHFGGGVRAARTAGSSPRARGTQHQADAERVHRRVIPACAGNTRRGRNQPPHGSGHPRVRGEHAIPVTSRVARVGSSPRARGTLPAGSAGSRALRVIPACAGNTAVPRVSPCAWPGHPRVRGEHLKCSMSTAQRIGSSPRARGTRVRRRPGRPRRRVIPACAGNTQAPAPLRTAAPGVIPACAGNTETK